MTIIAKKTLFGVHAQVSFAERIISLRAEILPAKRIIIRRAEIFLLRE
jgi:hypothetical protein